MSFVKSSRQPYEELRIEQVSPARLQVIGHEVISINTWRGNPIRTIPDNRAVDQEIISLMKENLQTRENTFRMI